MLLTPGTSIGDWKLHGWREVSSPRAQAASQQACQSRAGGPEEEALPCAVLGRKLKQVLALEGGWGGTGT